MRETGFGPFIFDCVTGELFRDGKPVALTPKATLVLGALLSSPGRLISHEELYEVAWDGTVVEFDQGLYTCIRQIRKALGDDARNPRYIETVPKRGYRFCHPLINAPQRKRGLVENFSFRAAAVVAATLLIFCGMVGLLRVQTWMAATPIDELALSDFRIDGFNISTGGIDRRLEASVRNGFAARGVNPDRDKPSYLLTGLITPADDGALFHVALVRLSDDETVWEGSYNPFCQEVEGDPIRLIGQLVAQTVIDKVKHTSA